MSSSQELSTKYQPSEVESRWYPVWEQNGLFGARADSKKKSYSIVIPPPNITGSLHMGHALNNTIQDILIRMHRMQGDEALWFPGTDHAGIATQTMVEKDLAKQGIRKKDIGREKFLEHVWAWREKYGRTIVDQLKRLGASCDWSRERFTMDPQCTKAVREAFYRLYKKKYIYKDKYIVNWCPRCLTALSDLEAEHEDDANAKLYHLKYPLEQPVGGRDSITIATTRPETILADVAIAVNPSDERYTDVVGKSAILPLVGRKLRIVADQHALKEFGSGALKVTPAHDLNDFEIGRRHKLETLVCMDERGKINDLFPKYQGLDRFECRKQIVEDLREGGYLVKEEQYTVPLAKCYRCHTVLEPYLSDQWFMDMSELAKPAIEVARDGRVQFFPERFGGLYLNWMENLRPWVLSRQLWWGHRVPIWTCVNGHQDSHIEDPTECPTCHSKEYSQETDVLDTWFSSGLWPLSTMGWPDEKAPDLNFFYPTAVLSTDRGILYLWVARMIMMGLEFKHEVPFHHVYIHATVLTRDGKRMSKSLGTGVDPLELFDKYGTDATRLGLMLMTSQGQDIRFYEERIGECMRFANKIWNAFRFSMPNFALAKGAASDYKSRWSVEDRWIMSRLHRLIELVGRSIDEYRFDVAAREMQDFFWGEFCDWYVELSKAVFYERDDTAEKEKTATILLEVFSTFLRLMHPIMPYLTEELWQQLPGDNGYVVVAPWPRFDASVHDEEADRHMGLLIDTMRGIRNMRADVNIEAKADVEVTAVFADGTARRILDANADVFRRMAHVVPLKVVEALAEKPQAAVSARCGGGEIFMPIGGHVDLAKETERLNKELSDITQYLERTSAKLNNPSFVEKAKPEVVERERAKVAELEENRQKVAHRLEVLKGLN
jgi:valyl-tRNA synthetase